MTDGPAIPSGTRPPVALRETCRLVEGRLPLWPYHRARLRAGGCGDATLAELESRVDEAIAGWKGRASNRTRLTLVVGPEGPIDVTIQQRLSSLDVPGGPTVAAVEVTASPWLPPGAAKPADRSWYDDVQRRARWADGHQALIVLDGLVIDGGSASGWTVSGGVVTTPPAPDAIAGVARAFLLDALARDSIPVRVEPLAVAAVQDADELFLTNAFGGAVAVRGRSGPVFERVSELFAAMWRG
jgi:branched-subunit amino acid aminotransferase/4-amino-4-deoxychorismate lyase